MNQRGGNMGKLELKVLVTREASIDEVRGLIWGTGALTWPWWGGVHEEEGGSFVFTHDGEDSEEGALDCRTRVLPSVILHAAGKYLSENQDSPDASEAINEDIGYLDAQEADLVLQMAVFGRLIYG